MLVVLNTSHLGGHAHRTVLELQTLSYLPDSRLPYVAAIC